MLARGVVSRSLLAEDCRGGELTIMSLSDGFDLGAGVPFAGDERKNSGDDEATLESLVCKPLDAD